MFVSCYRVFLFVVISFVDDLNSGVFTEIGCFEVIIFRDRLFLTKAAKRIIVL